MFLNKLFMKKSKISLILLLLCFSVLLMPMQSILAVTISKTSLALTNATASAVTTHTLSFTPGDTIDAVKSITIQYATTAGGSTVPTGLSMSATPSVSVTNNAVNVPNTASYASGLETITFTTATVLSATGSAVIITTPSITNPNAGNFFVNITALAADNVTVTDSGVAEAVCVAGIALSGTMNPSLSFTISGIGNNISNLGAMNTTTGSASANAINFGTFLVGTNTAAQQIVTATNAANGYSVYLQENRVLTAGIATIPNISGNLTWNNSTTLGLGVNVTAGTNGDVNTSLFTSNLLFAPIPVNVSNLVIATKNAQTTGNDTENVIYQLGINASQAAGTYGNSLSFVVTPNF